jgi:hypothetical protein
VPCRLSIGKLHLPFTRGKRLLRFQKSSMLLALRFYRIGVLLHPTTRPLKRAGSVLPLAGGEKSDIAFLSIRLVIQPWTNKRAVISHSAVFPKARLAARKSIALSLGESRQLDGGTTSPTRDTRRQAPLHRDSR